MNNFIQHTKVIWNQWSTENVELVSQYCVRWWSIYDHYMGKALQVIKSITSEGQLQPDYILVFGTTWLQTRLQIICKIYDMQKYYVGMSPSMVTTQVWSLYMTRTDSGSINMRYGPEPAHIRDNEVILYGGHSMDLQKYNTNLHKSMQLCNSNWDWCNNIIQTFVEGLWAC